MNKKVLIIEHDANIADLLRSCFTTEGYAASTTQSISQSIEYFQIEKPDVIILNIGLPAKSAYKILEGFDTNIPLIIIGDVPNEGDRGKIALSRKYNIKFFLKKPFRISQLLKIVGQIFLAARKKVVQPPPSPGKKAPPRRAPGLGFQKRRPGRFLGLWV